MAYIRLGELLLAERKITPADLQRAIELQRTTKERLGTVLIKSGLITEADLIQALQKQLGIEFIDLTKAPIPLEMAQVIPRATAMQYQIVPIKIENGELFLAMSDPLNFYALEEARKATKCRIHPLLATAEGIEHTIQLMYSSEGAAKAIAEIRLQTSEEDAPLVEDNFSGNRLGEDDDSAPTIRLVNSILERAVTERASDIHLESLENDMLVRMRVDGVMRRIMSVPKYVEAAVVSRIKIMSNLNIAERRVPQDGRFNIKVKDKDIDLRVSTLPTVFGEKIVMRLLDKSGGRVSKDAVGLTGPDMAKFDQMMNLRSGVLLIVGPTGSGKSTTMYAMINELNKEGVNMVTLEDPVEYNVSGVNQVQINDKVGMTFASGLRAILRQDPDVIALGEIRDGETAEIAMRAAITGHIVLSTIHTNDAVGTIERLRDIGVAPYVTASALRGVISQRLLRRVCPECRRAYAPTEDELFALGMKPEPMLRFYRGAGCPRCFNTGYRGRAAVFEMLIVDRNIRRMISENQPRAAIEEALNRPGSDFTSLRESALRLLRDGTTTVEEVLRVTSED